MKYDFRQKSAKKLLKLPKNIQTGILRKMFSTQNKLRN